MMKRWLATAACCVALAGCSGTPSWMQFEMPKSSPATNTVQFESEPAGAEAKTSTGQACRTPCSLEVAAPSFTVAFSLTGYRPQSTTVRVVGGEGIDPATGRPLPGRIDPNPVYVELTPAPPPPPPARKAPPKPKKTKAPAKAPGAAAPPPAPSAPAPAPAGAWPPPPPPPAR
jgi:hypothetical protein